MREYIKRYDPIPETLDIEGFEIPVRLPVRPPRKEMLNYGLPVEKQVFPYVKIPDGLQSAPIEEQTRFISREWHRRHNGVWALIGGEEVYVPGTAYLFFNYWIIEGKQPEYRQEALDFFLVANHVDDDDNCVGLVIVKPRRIGDSEKCFCWGWDRATKRRNQHFGNMSKVGDDSEANFKKIVAAHTTMPWFFKPVSSGMDQPTEAFVFRPPARRQTVSTMQSEQHEQMSERPLNSRIDWRTTTFKAYDGLKLTRFVFDEWAKTPISQLRVDKQMDVIFHCLTLQGGRKIIGKVMMPSTVEDDETGASMDHEQVALVRQMWDLSNPTVKNEFGRTVTGMYRYFRTHELLAPVDQFGRHDREAQAQWHRSTLDMLRAKHLSDKITDFLRKMPRNIEDALKIPSSQCVMYPALLDAQNEWMHDMRDSGRSHEARLEVSGELVWTNGIGSDVRWVPNPTGRFQMSQPPSRANNVQRAGGLPIPGNTGMYAIGIDPVDHKHLKSNKNPSNPAIAVFRLADPMAEPFGLNDDGEPLGQDGNVDITNSMTDQFVMTYEYRPYDPAEFYEDALKCMVFYGAPALVERNKPNLSYWVEDRGFKAFLADKPREIGGNPRKRGTAEQRGVTQTQYTINSWVELTKIWLVRRSQTLRHAKLLSSFRKFTGDNQGDLDLLVAAGYALQLANSWMSNRMRESATEKWERPPWGASANLLEKWNQT